MGSFVSRSAHALAGRHLERYCDRGLSEWRIGRLGDGGGVQHPARRRCSSGWRRHSPGPCELGGTVLSRFQSSILKCTCAGSSEYASFEALEISLIKTNVCSRLKNLTSSLSVAIFVGPQFLELEKLPVFKVSV